ncbi:MAG: TrkA family potassium uptake protein [Dictyoglomus thermophilum]|uniref:TrkA family potassium uptake protein n=1 Tax=Dictyoglomus thermophilum TaxID=14 RepID=A0A7C2H868_DICTH
MKSLSYRLKRAGLDKSRLNSFAVIGLGRFGASVAVTLERMGFSVIAIDKDENKVEEIKDYVSYAKVLDSTNINALREAGVQNVDVVIVSIAHDIEASVLTSLLVKELGVKFVIARAISEPHEKILDKIGVDLVVYPERDMGVRLAQRLVVPNVIDYMEFYANTKIFELEPPEAIIGKTIQELDLRKNYGLSIIAIQRGSELISDISPSERIQRGDILYIIGSFENLNKFLNKL